MKKIKLLKLQFGLLFLFFLGTPGVFAQTEFAGGQINYEGRLADSQGDPLPGPVAITIEILTADENCVLYAERHPTVSLDNGYFSLRIGGGNLEAWDPGIPMSQVFKNSSTPTVPSHATYCPGGNPVVGVNDQRYLRVTIDDGVNSEPLSPNQVIAAVPVALRADVATKAEDADTLQSFTSADFVQASGNVTQARVDDLAGKHTELMSLANGSSTDYLANGAAQLDLQDANPSLTLTSDDGAAGNMSIEFKDSNSSPEAKIGVTEGSQTLQIFTAGSEALRINESQNSFFAGAIQSVGPIRGGQFTETEETSIVLPGLVGCTPACIGAQWINTDRKELRYWDGANARSVASVGNGHTAGHVLTSNGPSAAPTWQAVDDTTKLSLDGSGTMSGALNMGSQAITNLASPSVGTDAANKAYADGNVLGLPLSAPTTGEDGMAIRWNDGAGNWEYFVPSAGSVSSVTASAPLASSGGATPDISLNFADGLTNNGGNLELKLSSDLGFDGSGNVIIADDGVTGSHILDGAIDNVDINVSAAIARSKLAGGTADRVLVNNTSGVMVDSSITSTELGQLSGVSSNIQTQLNGKQASIGFTPVNKAGDSMSGALSIQLPPNSTGGLDITSSGFGTPLLRFDGTSVAGGHVWTINGNSGGGGGENDNLRFINITSSGSVMELDGTNGRVGIGTAAPAEKLEVAGVIRSTTGGFKFPDGTVQTTAAGGGAAAAGSTGEIQFSDGGGVFQSNAALVWDDTNIRLGVGTASPSAGLEIASQNGPDIQVTSILANSADIRLLTANDNTSEIAFREDSEQWGANLQYNGPANRFDIQTVYSNNPTSHISIMRDQNFTLVGIGNESPDTTLHVSGAIKIGDSVQGCVSPADAGRIQYDSTGNLIQFCDGTGWMTLTTTATAGDGLGDHTATQNIVLAGNFLSGDGGSEGIAIDASGNVGIGTTTPATALDIGSKLRMDIASGGADIQADASAFRLKLGMDEATPAHMTIAGQGSQPSSFTNNGSIEIVSNDGSTSDIMLKAYDSLIFRTGLVQYGTVGQIPSMVITAAGNIGIGISAPTTKLAVAGDIQVDSGSDVCIDGGNCLSSITGESTSVSDVGAAGVNVYKQMSGSTIELRKINATGPVTVTLDSGNNEVDIGLSAGAFNALAPSQSGNSGKFLTTDGTNASWAIVPGDGFGSHTASQNIVLGSNYLSGDGDNEGITIEGATGNVGVGTITPQAKLDVNGEVKGQTARFEGHVRVGPANGSVCDNDVNNGGKLRYNTTTGNMEYCNHVLAQWVPLGPLDDRPNVFSVTDVSDVWPGLLITSEAVPLSEFDGSLTASVSGDGSPEICNYSAGCIWGASVLVSPGEEIRVRTTSSSTNGEVVSVNVTVGGVSDTWLVTTSSTVTTVDCSVAPTVGDKCNEGTVYAGTFDYQGENGLNVMSLMITPGGCTNSSTPTCAGTDSLTLAWGSDLEDHSGANFAKDGADNTTYLAANYTDTDAATYCENLEYAGYTDWYLPAIDEWLAIYPNKDAIGGFATTYQYYWSSTNSTTTSAEQINMSDGSTLTYTKTASGEHVRCIRRY